MSSVFVPNTRVQAMMYNLVQLRYNWLIQQGYFKEVVPTMIRSRKL